MVERKRRRLTRPLKFDKTYYESDISNFPNKKVFYKKWIILKSFGKLGNAYCYQVCDKKVESFGRLYIEICDEGMSSVGNMIEFLMKQNSVGNSHRFCYLIDSGMIHDHLIYMVTAERDGPRLSTLLDICKKDTRKTNGGYLPPDTAAFFALEFIQTLEILVSTGYVIRNFDPNQWNFDAKHRMIFLADPTDIVTMSDKRYSVISEQSYTGNMDLHWKGSVCYAPINALTLGKGHRMSEIDLIETGIYVLYEVGIGPLPWEKCVDMQKILDAKHEFLKLIPVIEGGKYPDVSTKWFDICLRNMNSFMKNAEKMHEIYSKQPVRGGAWCPNGSRAGSLITAMNYSALMDEFRKVVIGGKPSYRHHWRDIELAWERTINHNEQSLGILKSYERSCHKKEIVYEKKVLDAKKTHYEVMAEHGKAEKSVNEVEIGQYLSPEPETLKIEVDELENDEKEKKEVDREENTVSGSTNCPVTSDVKPKSGEMKPRSKKMRIESSSDTSAETSPIKNLNSDSFHEN